MFRRHTARASLAILVMIAVAPCTQLAAAEFTIDADRTVVSFQLRALGTTQRGEFNGVAGAVLLDSGAEGGWIDIVIDARSVAVAAVPIERIVRGPAMLDVAAYPQIAYKAESVIFADGRPARIDGKLTLRGLTRDVPLAVSRYECTNPSSFDPQRCAIVATASFKRSEFGMTRYRMLANDEIELAIHAEGVRVAAERQVELR